MSAEELKFVKTQLKWADSEKLDPAQGNYVKWRLKIRDWLIYNGLWCLIEPVKPEQQQEKAKVAVEDQGLSVELHRSDHDILELAATERVAWINPVANLQNSIRNLDPCRARQLI